VELANITASQTGQFAWDAIVAIVHKTNPITNVTAETLKKIYSGEYTTWDDLPSEESH
jgi:phosphate transport system substrate-binding protein